MMAENSKPVRSDPFFPLSCPHCHSRARIRGGRQLTSLAREARVQCLNAECGHTFVGQFVITHTISPSVCPDPAVDLRIAPPRRPTSGNDNGVTREQAHPFVDTG